MFNRNRITAAARQVGDTVATLAPRDRTLYVTLNGTVRKAHVVKVDHDGDDLTLEVEYVDGAGRKRALVKYSAGEGADAVPAGHEVVGAYSVEYKGYAPKEDAPATDEASDDNLAEVSRKAAETEPRTTAAGPALTEHRPTAAEQAAAAADPLAPSAAAVQVDAAIAEDAA